MSPAGGQFDPDFLFKDTKLCTSTSYSYCATAFSYNSQNMGIIAKAGDAMRIDFHFRDEDTGSSDDDFCKGSMTGTVGVSSKGLTVVAGDPVFANNYVLRRISGTDYASNKCKIFINI